MARPEKNCGERVGDLDYGPQLADCVSWKSFPLWSRCSLSTERDADSDELKGMKCFVTNTSQMSRFNSPLLPGTRESENSAFSFC